MAEASLQVLIPASSLLVAGLPPSVRAAHNAAAEFPGARIVFCGQDAGFVRRFRRQLAALQPSYVGSEPARRRLDAKGPWLVLSPEGFPAAQALREFVEKARALGAPARWLCAGQAAAAYYPADATQPLLDAAATDAARQALKQGQALTAPGWTPVVDAAGALAAEKAIFEALPKDTDGYIARLDRKLSMALSSSLLRWPVTPNGITTASLALGLLGAWWLASGRYDYTLAGAALLWFCCLLDGCDGEVARLKLLCSPSGAAYDLAADYIAHVATFIAIPIGVHRAFPQASLLIPAALLVSGFLACTLSVWHLVLRKPTGKRGPHALLIERVASRDYVYLLALLALAGRLDWFLYAAGVGSHLFWAALWLIA